MVETNLVFEYSLIFWPLLLTIGILLYYVKHCASFQFHRVNSNWSYSPVTLNSGRNWRYFVPCYLEIQWITWWGTPLLHKAFCIISNPWVKSKLCYSPKTPYSGQNWWFFVVTLKFDGWAWTTIGHLFYTTLSFVHHFKAIGELKLEGQFENAEFGSKSALFCCMWPWNLTDYHEKL